MISGLGIGIATSIFGLAFNALWKRALHIIYYTINYSNTTHKETRVRYELPVLRVSEDGQPIQWGREVQAGPPPIWELEAGGGTIQIFVHAIKGFITIHIYIYIYILIDIQFS